MTKTITITSGKGGVGKTNTSLNLAITLAKQGQKVCLFDADFGMANINILLGLQPKHTIYDVMQGRKTMQDIMMRDIHGIDVIPGSSGIEAMGEISQSQINYLLSEFKTLPDYDYLLLDTAAGISKHVLSFCLAATEVILIITHEPTSLTDAYGLLKILTANGYTGLVKVIINRCHNSQNASTTYAVFKKSVATFLKREISPLGLILEDAKMTSAIHQQRPLAIRFPSSKSAKCFNIISQKIINDDILKEDDIVNFWQRCLDIMKGPIKMLPKSRSKEIKEQPQLQGYSLDIAHEISLLRQAIEQVATRMSLPDQPCQKKQQAKQVIGPAVELDLDTFIQQSLEEDERPTST